MSIVCRIYLQDRRERRKVYGAKGTCMPDRDEEQALMKHDDVGAGNRGNLPGAT